MLSNNGVIAGGTWGFGRCFPFLFW